MAVLCIISIRLLVQSFQLKNFCSGWWNIRVEYNYKVLGLEEEKVEAEPTSKGEETN
jgi:hypothetical protein